MRIFLSYASEDRALAEDIQLALVGAGHVVFFDKASLPAGGNYHARIESAVKRCDLFIFLISQNSVASGSYALTELKFARVKWHHPKERVLPVRLHGTAWELIPPYLKSVTVLEPEGNVSAEIVEAVSTMAAGDAAKPQGASGLEQTDTSINTETISKRLWVVIAAIAIGLGGVVYVNRETIFPPRPADLPSIAAGMQGSDAGNSKFLDRDDCPETTEYDYSKIPPESRIVKRCLTP